MPRKGMSPPSEPCLGIAAALGTQAVAPGAGPRPKRSWEASEGLLRLTSLAGLHESQGCPPPPCCLLEQAGIRGGQGHAIAPLWECAFGRRLRLRGDRAPAHLPNLSLPGDNPGCPRGAEASLGFLTSHPQLPEGPRPTPVASRVAVSPASSLRQAHALRAGPCGDSSAGCGRAEPRAGRQRPWEGRARQGAQWGGPHGGGGHRLRAPWRSAAVLTVSSCRPPSAVSPSGKRLCGVPVELGFTPSISR